MKYLAMSAALIGLLLVGTASASDYSYVNRGGYGSGHTHYVPGHLDRHRGHYDYHPGHFEYHRGNDYSRDGYNRGIYNTPGYGGYNRGSSFYTPSYRQGHHNH
jgi:hypothetical protein